VFLASVGTSEGLPALVSRAWDLSGLVERYASFAGEFSQYVSRGGRPRRLTDPEAFLIRTRLIHLFRGFPFVDPELPDELADVSRARAEAVAVFRVLYDGLAEPSQRHFTAITERYVRPDRE
jgi:phenylacetic acid degradation operon negative regulatory protein